MTNSGSIYRQNVRTKSLEILLTQTRGHGDGSTTG